MKRILKYQLKPSSEQQIIELPEGSTILSAQMQILGISLWAMVPVPDFADLDDEEAFNPSMATYEFFCIPTGAYIPDDFIDNYKHLDTVQLAGGKIILHVFYRKA